MLFVSLMQQCVYDLSQGRMLLTFCLAVCPLSGTGEGILCMPCTLCLLVLGEWPVG